MNFRKHGFTLIELLVTIVIIGILSTIAISTFSGYFAKARDAKRISTIRDLNKAILLYYSQKGKFPCRSANNSVFWYIDDKESCLPKTLINEGFLDSFEPDPKYGNDGKEINGQDYLYRVLYKPNNPSGKIEEAYILRTKLETDILPRSHSHPEGTACQDLPKYPKCRWFQGDCVYVTAPKCNEYWLHLSKSFNKK